MSVNPPNIPDRPKSWKCTECSNRIYRTNERGRPRLTCSEQCARARGSLKRRNQGERVNHAARHAPEENSLEAVSETDAAQEESTSAPVETSGPPLRLALRELEHALVSATKHLPNLRRKDWSIMHNLASKANNLRLAVEETIDDKES